MSSPQKTAPTATGETDNLPSHLKGRPLSADEACTWFKDPVVKQVGRAPPEKVTTKRKMGEYAYVVSAKGSGSSTKTDSSKDRISPPKKSKNLSNDGDIPNNVVIAKHNAQESNKSRSDDDIPNNVVITKHNAQEYYGPEMCLFIANLNQEMSDLAIEAEIVERVKHIGAVYVKVTRGRNNMPQAHAQFTSVRHAQHASYTLTGKNLTGRPPRIEWANPSLTYAFGLRRKHWNVTIDNGLKKIRQNYGGFKKVPLTDAQKVDTGLGDGFAITFKNFQTGALAANDMHGGDYVMKVLKNRNAPRKVVSQNAVKAEKDLQEIAVNFASVFVGNLFEDVTVQDIKDLFRDKELGEVREVTIQQQASSREGCKYHTFAFVQLSNAEVVKKAVEVLHGAWYVGQKLKVQPKNFSGSKSASKKAANSVVGKSALSRSFGSRVGSLVDDISPYESIANGYGAIVDTVVENAVSQPAIALGNAVSSAVGATAPWNFQAPAVNTMGYLNNGFYQGTFPAGFHGPGAQNAPFAGASSAPAAYFGPSVHYGPGAFSAAAAAYAPGLFGGPPPFSGPNAFTTPSMYTAPQGAYSTPPFYGGASAPAAYNGPSAWSAPVAYGPGAFTAAQQSPMYKSDSAIHKWLNTGTYSGYSAQGPLPGPDFALNGGNLPTVFTTNVGQFSGAQAGGSPGGDEIFNFEEFNSISS